MFYDFIIMQVWLTAMKDQKVQESSREENLIFFENSFLIAKQFSLKHPEWNIMQLRKLLNQQILLTRDNLSGRYTETTQSLVKFIICKGSF